MPAAMIALTGRGAVVDAGEVDQHRADGRRVLASARTQTLVAMPQHPLAADERAAQVVDRPAPASSPPSMHDLAVGQHDLEAEDVRVGDAVGEAVRPAGVVGDVAADRAALLAAGIRSEVQAVAARPPW